MRALVMARQEGHAMRRYDNEILIDHAFRYAKKAPSTTPTDRDPGFARRGSPPSRAQSACRYGLCRPLYISGIHRDVPGDGAAGLRDPRDRLCAPRLAGGIEIAQALSQQLPQSWCIP